MESERCRRLTRQQVACLRLVAQGMSSKQISVRLDIQPGTVDQYLKDASAILGTRTRSQAAVVLMRFETASSSPKSEPQPPGLAESGDRDSSFVPAGGDSVLPGMAGWFATLEEQVPFGRSSSARSGPAGPGEEGGQRNRLRLWQKLAIIVGGAVLVAFAVTGLAVAMRAVAEMIAG